jgi:hypothetical protein
MRITVHSIQRLTVVAMAHSNPSILQTPIILQNFVQNSTKSYSAKLFSPASFELGRSPSPVSLDGFSRFFKWRSPQHQSFETPSSSPMIDIPSSIFWEKVRKNLGTSSI